MDTHKAKVYGAWTHPERGTIIRGRLRRNRRRLFFSTAVTRNAHHGRGAHPGDVNLNEGLIAIVQNDGLWTVFDCEISLHQLPPLDNEWTFVEDSGLKTLEKFRYHPTFSPVEWIVICAQIFTRI